MCAAVVPEVNPLNVALTCSVWAVGSSTTVAEPVPAGLTGGTSFAPERFSSKVIGIACAAGTGSIRAATVMTNAGKGTSALSVMIFLRRLWKINRRQITVQCPDFDAVLPNNISKPQLINSVNSNQIYGPSRIDAELTKFQNRRGRRMVFRAPFVMARCHPRFASPTRLL